MAAADAVGKPTRT